MGGTQEEETLQKEGGSEDKALRITALSMFHLLVLSQKGAGCVVNFCILLYLLD